MRCEFVTKLGKYSNRGVLMWLRPLGWLTGRCFVLTAALAIRVKSFWSNRSPNCSTLWRASIQSRRTTLAGPAHNRALQEASDSQQKIVTIYYGNDIINLTMGSVLCAGTEKKTFRVFCMPRRGRKIAHHQRFACAFFVVAGVVRFSCVTLGREQLTDASRTCIASDGSDDTQKKVEKRAAVESECAPNKFP